MAAYGYNFNAENGYAKVSISRLDDAPMYSTVYGVVVGKSDPRFVATKSSGERYVLNFTIRDSPSDAVNVVCWGDENQIKAVSSVFSIGDVVRIKNPQIVSRLSDSGSAKFRPQVSSPHELIISPKNSEIAVCDGDEASDYCYFLHSPMPNASDYITLADVIYDAENLEGTTANLLVAVRHLGSLQTLQAKDGRTLKKLELIVFDETHSSFSVLIWDEATAHFILKYCAPKCILLITDVRLNFSRFSNEVVATAVSSTIFTPEPDIPDGRVLYQYAQTMISESTDDGPLQVCTVSQLHHRLYSAPLAALEDIKGFVFAYLTGFDIDGTTKITSLKCPKCKQAIRGKLERCVNGNCEIGVSGRTSDLQVVFDLSVNISDHTGTLRRCSMYDHVAENFLKCSAEEFLKKPIDEKTTIKWQCLLEKCKIEFMVPYSSVLVGNPRINITSCEKCNPEEFVKYISVLF